MPWHALLMALIQRATVVADGAGSPLQMVCSCRRHPSRWCCAEGDGTGGVRTRVGADVMGADGVSLEGIGFMRPCPSCTTTSHIPNNTYIVSCTSLFNYILP